MTHVFLRFSALGENPLPTLGASTEAYEENTMRFFKSTSQPLMITTAPPSMIEPTSVTKSTISNTIKPSLSSVSMQSSSPINTSNKESQSSQMEMSVSEIMLGNSAEKLEKSHDEEKEAKTTIFDTSKPDETLQQPTKEPMSKVAEETQIRTEEAIEAKVSDSELLSSFEPIVSSSIEDLFVSTSLISSSSSTTELKVETSSSSKFDRSTEENTSEISSISSSVNVSFLAPRVSSMAASASRPENQPRVAPANIEAVEKMIIGEPGMQIINKTEKKTRQSDESPQLPGVNDLLNGLLNVVGEGLTFATNFVKEENERKKEAASKLAAEKELLQSSISAVPALLPGRINNRGPPRFTEIPFEAIPLEILNSQRPGQKPVQIPQRPFHTRIKITKTKLPPFASGIPLPEVLIPGFEMPTTTNPPTEATTTELENALTANASLENRVRFPAPNSTPNPAKINLVKLQNQYNVKPSLDLKGDDVDLKLLKPTRVNDETTTIYATASNILPKWPPRRKPIPGKIEVTRRPPPLPTNQIRTPPLRPRPYPRPPLRQPPPQASQPQNNIVVDPLAGEPEVLFSGQAFDVQPSRQPPLQRPEIFDLTVSVQQNFGAGNRKPSLNQNGNHFSNVRFLFSFLLS